MNDIPIKDALILWNNGFNGGVPKFAVRPIGHDDYYEYDGQVGACFDQWREANTNSRKLLLMVEIWQIANFYLVPVEMMAPELLKIPEYRDMLAIDCLPKEFQMERLAEVG